MKRQVQRGDSATGQCKQAVQGVNQGDRKSRGSTYMKGSSEGRPGGNFSGYMLLAYVTGGGRDLLNSWLLTKQANDVKVGDLKAALGTQA